MKKTLLVELPTECPNCNEFLTRGDIMYQAGKKVTCGYCDKNASKKITINGKEWTVNIKPLSLSRPVKKTGVFDMVAFASQLTGFMPKVDTQTEYGEINPTQWGEEVK